MNIFLQDAATLLDTAVWYAAVVYAAMGCLLLPLL